MMLWLAGSSGEGTELSPKLRYMGFSAKCNVSRVAKKFGSVGMMFLKYSLVISSMVICAAWSGMGVVGISAAGIRRKAEASANPTNACLDLSPGRDASQRTSRGELTRSVSSSEESCLANFSSGLPFSVVSNFSNSATVTCFAANAGRVTPVSNSASASCRFERSERIVESQLNYRALTQPWSMPDCYLLRGNCHGDFQ